MLIVLTTVLQQIATSLIYIIRLNLKYFKSHDDEVAVCDGSSYRNGNNFP